MVTRRRSLTNSSPPSDLPPQRRLSGARHVVAKRVSLFQGEREVDGWALNISRGGLRAIVEEEIDLGADFEIAIEGEDARRRGRVVWVQDEPDGSVIGISFVSASAKEPEQGSQRPA